MSKSFSVRTLLIAFAMVAIGLAAWPRFSEYRALRWVRQTGGMVFPQIDGTIELNLGPDVPDSEVSRLSSVRNLVLVRTMSNSAFWIPPEGRVMYGMTRSETWEKVKRLVKDRTKMLPDEPVYQPLLEDI